MKVFLTGGSGKIGRVIKHTLEQEGIRVISPNSEELNLNKNFDSFLNWILELRQNLNIPHKLSDVMDCNNIDLDELSLMAFEDPSTGGNPKKLSQNDLKEMYIKSISGELF